MTPRRPFLLLMLLFFVLLSCTEKVPDNYRQADVLPPVYPDYADVTVPVNIAPLRFEVFAHADAAVTRFSSGSSEIVCGGLKVCPSVDEWHDMLAAAQGSDVSVEVFIRDEGQWLRFQPFSIHVSPDSIDPWISYRLISPSYVSYEELTINQRCLENYDESVIVDNMLCSTEFGGQCVNCHSYQQYNPQRMQFHARQTHAGTVIAYDGHLEKVDMRSDSLISAGVYPAWHPWLKLIAYSTNKTMQSFHTSHPNKIEVLDSESDLILYDIDSHRVTTIEREPDELEIYPAWSPDGRSLYFCSAHFHYASDSVNTEEIIMRAQDVRYNIYRKAFDPDTRQFGPREMVFCADTLLRSATLPRISPDGRWLLFTLGEWGCFHIWHHDADLWMMDLAGLESDSVAIDVDSIAQSLTPTTSVARPLDEINSPDTESYHSWSSNGRWIIFSSRRHDGVFTRPFIAHIDADGRGAKPFELPCHDPDRHLQMLKSYNVPEFMRGPVTITPQQFAAALRQKTHVQAIGDEHLGR
ncbi:MAG: hypothetical protein K6A96_14660 [Prevotella sp.]|nr:hypothetical protein [Prevotella sp.]